MYPAQTSLIPVQIALARFLGQGGNIFSHYPYWYLGTTPYRYLTGPVLPTVLATLHKILPFLSLFEIMLGLVGLVWVIGGAGVYWLVKELVTQSKRVKERESKKEGKKIAFLATLFYLFSPIVPFLFRFSNGLYLIAFSFLPFVLLAYLRLLKRWTRQQAILLSTLTAFLILLDTLIISTLIFGMAAIFLAQTGWKKAEEKLKQTFLVLSFSLLIATFWYLPGYWLTLLGAPSLAGKGLAGVMVWLGKLLPAALAFGIAIASVKFFKKRNLLRDFCFYWLFIFGCLTLLRFLSDPDFWLDWIAYGTELQFGLAIAMSLIVARLLPSIKSSLIRNSLFVILLTPYLLLFTFTFSQYVLGTLQPDITKTVEYRIGKQLSEIAKPGEKALFSGTTGFWLNAFFDIPQVRGGVDQASVDSSWREAVWEIREGTDPEKSVQWFKMLKIAYIVVHTKDSEEFYHDFARPEKFEEALNLEKIYDQEGNRIYQLQE